jgi:DNA-binding transcriptional MerR regulator
LTGIKVKKTKEFGFMPLSKSDQEKVDSLLYLSLDYVVDYMNFYRINTTKRNLTYYREMGLLKKPFRLPGDRRAFYERDYIFDTLRAIHFLKGTLSLSIEEIRTLIKFGRKDIVGICEDFQEALFRLGKADKQEVLPFSPEVVVFAKIYTHFLLHKKVTDKDEKGRTELIKDCVQHFFKYREAGRLIHDGKLAEADRLMDQIRLPQV